MQELCTLGTFGAGFRIAALSVAVGCPPGKSQSRIQDGLGCLSRTVKIENSPLPPTSNIICTVACYNMQGMFNIRMGGCSILGGVDDLGY